MKYTGTADTGSKERGDTPRRRVTTAVLGRMHEHASGYPRRESDGDQEGDSVGGHNGHGTAAADADGRRDTANRAAVRSTDRYDRPGFPRVRASRLSAQAHASRGRGSRPRPFVRRERTAPAPRDRLQARNSPKGRGKPRRITRSSHSAFARAPGCGARLWHDGHGTSRAPCPRPAVPQPRTGSNGLRYLSRHVRRRL